MSNDPASEFRFRGGGNVLHKHHMTRYIYPCLFHYDKTQLRTQPPNNSAKRSRPQGRGSWDNTFVSITLAGLNRPAPTLKDFERKFITETRNHDGKSRNPLGRAMRRVSAYEGNTTLEAGKIKLKDGLHYVIKRTTVVPLAKGQSSRVARDSETYKIPVGKWRSLQPPSDFGYDCWWTRLHDLFTGSSDRAWWNVMDQFENVLQLPTPQENWLQRGDIPAIKDIKLLHKKVALPADQGACVSCMDDFFVDSDTPCQFKCGHLLCLTCLIPLIDDADKSKLDKDEVDKYPDGPFIRCPTCRFFISIKTSRLDHIRPDEFKFWRWLTVRDGLDNMLKRDFVPEIMNSAFDNYIPPIDTTNAEHPDLPLNPFDAAKAPIRAKDLTDWMIRVPIFAASLQPWGYTPDNPATFYESRVLHDAFKKEFKRLEQTKQKFTTNALQDHLLQLATKTVVSSTQGWKKEDRLGNPVFPPGFEEYREWLCDWTAYGAFFRPAARGELYEFLARMGKEKKVWWKGHVFLRKAS